MIVCLNGRLVSEKKAHISIHDHGFLYGDGLYETVRVRDGEPQFLQEHLKRLARGRRRLRLLTRWTDARLAVLIKKTIRANRLSEAAVRLTLTRGPGPQGFDPRLCRTPTLLITARPFSGYDALRARGLTLALVDVRRNAPDSTPPDIKSISCVNGVLAKIESLSMGADEALLLNQNGDIAEGSVSNIFLVKNGVLYTPRLDGNQLPGVTRTVVCRLAHRLRVPLRESVVRPRQLMNADEIFLTSALMNVMPVRKLLWKSGSRRERRDFSFGLLTRFLWNSLDTGCRPR